MNAQEARAVSEQAGREGKHVLDLVAHVKAKVAVASRDHKFEITFPLDGGRSTERITEEDEESVWNALRAEGYKVKHHPNPDPSHPCSRAYTTISW